MKEVILALRKIDKIKTLLYELGDIIHPEIKKEDFKKEINFLNKFFEKRTKQVKEEDIWIEAEKKKLNKVRVMGCLEYLRLDAEVFQPKRGEWMKI